MTDIYADTTSVPPREFLPKALHNLLDARDAAYDAFVEFESEHVMLLDSTWEARAIAADEAAGAEAMRSGKDPLDTPSKLDEGQRQRPKVLGALKVLAAEVRRTDAALVAAVRRELPAIEAATEPVIASAASEYVAAENAANAARARYGASLLLRSWVTDWRQLGLRPDFPAGIAEAAPRDATGQSVTDGYGREVRGAAEVKAIEASYGRPLRFERLVHVRLRNGVVTDNVKESHAADLVNKGAAEYVNPADVPVVPVRD